MNSSIKEKRLRLYSQDNRIKFRSKILQNESIYSLPHIDWVKLFLKEELGLDCEKLSFVEIKQQFIDLTFLKKLYTTILNHNNEEQFYIYLLENHFNEFIFRSKQERDTYLTNLINNENYLYTHSRIEIAKRCLQEILYIDINHFPDEDIIQQYQNKTKDNDIPTDNFYIYIAETYLQIHEEPSIRLNDIFLIVQTHLGEIDTNIKIINSSKIYNNNSHKTKEQLENDKSRFLRTQDFYRSINNMDRNDIYNFLLPETFNDWFIKLGLNTNFKETIPYYFSKIPNDWKKHKYLLPIQPELVNKFLDLKLNDTQAYDTIIKTYNNDNPDEFITLSLDYINTKDGHGNNKIDYIHNLIKSSPILFKRRKILEELIQLFINPSEDYLYFNSIATIQIEGIFKDLLTELKIQDNASITSTLHQLREQGQKHSNEHKNYVLDESYLYFSQYFPEIRNKIAHGEIINDQKTAIIIFLDLYDALDNVYHASLDLHESLKCLQKLSKIETYKDPKNFTFTGLYWIPLIKTPLPYNDGNTLNYKLGEDLKKTILQIYSSDFFWFYIRVIPPNASPFGKITVIELIKKLKSFKIAEEHCSAYLNKMGLQRKPAPENQSS